MRTRRRHRVVRSPRPMKNASPAGLALRFINRSLLRSSTPASLRSRPSGRRSSQTPQMRHRQKPAARLRPLVSVSSCFSLMSLILRQMSHARVRGGRKSGSGSSPIPVEWLGLGSAATVPMNSGPTIISMGSGTPQAKTQTSELSMLDAMLPISQSVCPVGQAFAVANISPRANMMKLARKSLMRAAIKPERECIMVPAQSGASAPSANHKLGSAS